MKKLRTLSPKVQAKDTCTTRLPPKVKDAVYNTDALFKAWRALMVQRAGLRCEHVDHHGP